MKSGSYPAFGWLPQERIPNSKVFNMTPIRMLSKSTLNKIIFCLVKPIITFKIPFYFYFYGWTWFLSKYVNFCFELRTCWSFNNHPILSITGYNL